MAKDPRESMDIRNTDEEYGFEQKELKVRKIYWVLITVFVAAGLLGVFGKGVLSSTKAKGTGYYLEYERFLRDETPTNISVFLEKNPGDSATVAINKEYVERIRMQGIVPQPASVKAKENQLIYTFSASDNGLITFNFVPQHTGSMRLTVTVQGETKHLNQYVFF